MIDGATPGGTSYDGNAVFTAIGGVYFLGGILVTAHDDRRRVSPDEKDARVFRRQRVEQGFFQSEIEGRVGGFHAQGVHTDSLGN